MQQFKRNFVKLSQSQLGKYPQKYGSLHPLMNYGDQFSFFQNPYHQIQKLYTNIDYKQLLENYYQKNHYDQKRENHENHSRDSDND